MELIIVGGGRAKEWGGVWRETYLRIKISKSVTQQSNSLKGPKGKSKTME